MNEKEFGDLCYDVWMAGGNPDLVDRDSFEEYDFLSDTGILRKELKKQNRHREEGEGE